MICGSPSILFKYTYMRSCLLHVQGLNDEIHTFNLCSHMFKPQPTCSGMHTITKHCTIWNRTIFNNKCSYHCMLVLFILLVSTSIKH